MNTLTLQKMRYLVAVAEKGSITGAAGELFVSQPSLTKTIHEVEDEVGIRIFERSSKGISVTKKGEEFLAYVRQVLEQADLLQEHFLQQGARKRLFCISSQHYAFAVRAFADLVREYADDRYDFSFRETATYEIVEDVAEMKSALGILFLNDYNETVLRRLFKERNCVFEEVCAMQPHALLSRSHPLAQRESLLPEELAPYPYLCYEQGAHNSLYLAEEMCSGVEPSRTIRVRDRATLCNLLAGVNGYTVSCGSLDGAFPNLEPVAVPLRGQGSMRIGYITHRNRLLGPLSRFYLQALRRYTASAGA
ncbi:MAG: LysR family transcriptional regulator [Akkermansia sp.]